MRDHHVLVVLKKGLQACGVGDIVPSRMAERLPPRQTRKDDKP